MFPVVCAACGKDTFPTVEGKPVYRECFGPPTRNDY